MDLSPPRWFAHRGGGSLAPENTLAGIRLASRLGYRAVEFDVMLSGDASPFLLHDETLERTTSGRGLVSQTPDAILRCLDAGGGEPPPTLAEAAQLCRASHLLANVEIKPSTGFAVQTAEVVVRQAQQLWLGADLPPLLSSFSIEALEIARDLAPALPRAVLFETIPDDWLCIVQQLGAVAVHCCAEQLDENLARDIVDRNILLRCYTVNAPETAKRLFALGVGGLFTDRLDLFAPTPSSGMQSAA
jgi:glycerophosphoryl diester phosphodiesterase